MDNLIHELLNFTKDYSNICNNASIGSTGGNVSGNVSSYRNMFRDILENARKREEIIHHKSEIIKNEIKNYENLEKESKVLEEDFDAKGLKKEDYSLLILALFRKLGIRFFENPNTQKLKVIIDNASDEYEVSNYLWNLVFELEEEERNKHFLIDWEEFEKEYDSDEDPNIDDSWGDWNEEELQPTLCLFCETISPSTKDTKFHMKDIHGFDLLKIKKNMGLDFYQTIILINYIRHKTLNNSCMACNQSFENSEKLLEHMKQENCFIKVPDLSNSFWKDTI
ncbi:2167_t:CDS:2 [Entrophospora sp. SA101]|nr:2167_t:CDS:2 [Entrophospora sp. SA101]